MLLVTKTEKTKSMPEMCRNIIPLSKGNRGKLKISPNCYLLPNGNIVLIFVQLSLNFKSVQVLNSFAKLKTSVPGHPDARQIADEA
jgi:hypothetical protein